MNTLSELKRLAAVDRKAMPPSLHEFLNRTEINPDWKGAVETDCTWKIVKSGSDYFVALVPKWMLTDQIAYNDYEHAAGHIADCYVADLQDVNKEMEPLLRKKWNIESKLSKHHTKE